MEIDKHRTPTGTDSKVHAVAVSDDDDDDDDDIMLQMGMNQSNNRLEILPILALELKRVCFVPGGYFGVGKDTKQKLHVDARFPRARNDEIVSLFQVMEIRYFRSVIDCTAYLLLDALSVAVCIYLSV